MRQSISRFFGQLAKFFGEGEVQEVILPKLEPQEEIEQEAIQKTEEIKETPAFVEGNKNNKKQAKERKKESGKKQKDGELVIVTTEPRDIRDVMELMNIPIVSLSKNRTAPIIYESQGLKVRISGHPPHYVASIYDWDIVLFVVNKIQEIINSGEDIPPRTLIFPRHELLKAICRHDGKKEEKDLKASLSRLKLTGIETTIRNEDGRYDAGFGFLDSWGYTDRKDIKEIKITLSQWLYDGACIKGALLKSDARYFNLTSGLKKFLYRIARKHVGTKNDSWTFSLETLYERSGSEQEFKKFKYDLKKVVSDNDIPEYFLKWIEEDKKTSVCFMNKIKYLKKDLSEPNSQPSLPSL
jgi:plasmid replication initiation protein